MNTGHIHQNYPIQPAGRRLARRRQLLGILLIVVGSVWICLRLTGWVGDMPWLVGWVERTGDIVERFNTGELALSVPLAACGMLFPSTIRRAP